MLSWFPLMNIQGGKCKPEFHSESVYNGYAFFLNTKLQATTQETKEASAVQKQQNCLSLKCVIFEDIMLKISIITGNPPPLLFSTSKKPSSLGDSHQHNSNMSKECFPHGATWRNYSGSQGPGGLKLTKKPTVNQSAFGTQRGQ